MTIKWNVIGYEVLTTKKLPRPVQKNMSAHGAKVWAQDQTVLQYTLSLLYSPCSKILLLVAIVAPHWIVFGRACQQCAVPTSATIIGFATPCAIAAGDELTHELVAASTLTLQGPRVASLEHVLQCKHAQETAVARGVVGMEVIICILQRQEGLVCCSTAPSDHRPQHWVIRGIISLTALLQEFVFLGIVSALAAAAAADLQGACQVSVPKVGAFIIWQRIHWLLQSPQAECPLIRFEVIESNDSLPCT